MGRLRGESGHHRANDAVTTVTEEGVDVGKRCLHARGHGFAQKPLGAMQAHFGRLFGDLERGRGFGGAHLLHLAHDEDDAVDGGQLVDGSFALRRGS